MDYPQLFSLLEERRSCRSFQPEPVPEQNEIAKIIRAGQQAPNPLNLQPWSFVVVTDPGTKKELRQAGEEAKQAVLEQGGPGWVGGFSIDFMEAAPLVIAVVVDPAKGGLGDYFNQPTGSIQAGSACIQNMMLAAAALGYGSLWFTFFDPARVREILKIPAHLAIAGLVYIGRAAGEIPASRRRAAVVYDGCFGREAADA
ncbi:MAG: nitroreductase family protein [Deltaproteobacteria bacterium]|nr:nitroreductase family protein [Deltaproteobacteria bacterium]